MLILHMAKEVNLNPHQTPNTKLCCLRGEGRRGWEGRVKNGVRMKHMITLD